MDRYLKSPADIAAYLNAAMEEGGESVLLVAIREVINAVGNMSELSRDTGLSRESLYKTLSENGNPKLSSLLAILHALGLEVAIKVRKRRAA